MQSQEALKYKGLISKNLRQARQERGWTQSKLAELIGISQNRLSEIERGQGSFTAEQLLVILGKFNLSIRDLVPRIGSPADEIQNSLARLGAPHLEESPGLLPADRLHDALGVIREVLVGALSPRQIAALAPVIVNHGDAPTLNKAKNQLADLGLDRRICWALENTLAAIRSEPDDILPREWRVAYRRAQARLGGLAMSWRMFTRRQGLPDDILDPDIVSRKTIERVKVESSSLSKDWGIVTRIEVDDFRRALRDARGAD